MRRIAVGRRSVVPLALLGVDPRLVPASNPDLDDCPDYEDDEVLANLLYEANEWLYVDASGAEDEAFETGLTGTLDAFYQAPGGVLMLKGDNPFFFEGLQAICGTQLFLLNPLWRNQGSEKRLHKQVYESYINDTFIPAGFIFDALDLDGSGGAINVAARLLHNATLAAGTDTPIHAQLLAQGVFFAVSGANGTNLAYEGYRAFPYRDFTFYIDYEGLIGPFMLCMAAPLLMPQIVGALVYERERGLGPLMMAMGTMPVALWVTSFAFYLVIYTAGMVLMFAAGVLMLIGLFTDNSLLLLAGAFALFGPAIVSHGFFLSNFFSRSRSATTLLYLYVIIAATMAFSLLDNISRQADVPPFWLEAIIHVSPINTLFMVLNEFIIYASDLGPGISFANVADTRYARYLAWFAVQFVVYTVVSLYVDQVRSQGRKFYFAFEPAFWREIFGQDVVQKYDRTVVAAVEGEADDVVAARTTVAQLADPAQCGFVLHNLRKEYKTKGGKFVAVQSLTMAVPRNMVYCLLGPNGAGKSTTLVCSALCAISRVCMCVCVLLLTYLPLPPSFSQSIVAGLLPQTSGTAWCDGHDIRHEIKAVHENMGLCPQEDVIWEMMTAREHLAFYGRIKGLSGAALATAVDAGLEGVSLVEAGDRVAGAYSGGMKRRLQVACALMGSPAAVMLDEPSTGLDPASRSKLWETILAAKAASTIMLTTHSMEEADVLSDRIAIMAGGVLKTLDEPANLVSRFGAGYKIALSIQDARHEAAEAFMAQHLPKATLLNKVGAMINYEMVRADAQLADMLEMFMKQDAADTGIADWAVSGSTLEQVFSTVILDN